tara:strand:+ start:10887 stop:11279 length:393 start_codon:yes stop_codon:yes gene_type:complete
MTDQFEPNEEDVSIIRSIAESDMDRPVLMLNLNRYFESLSFPGGKLYKSYMGVVSKLLESLGGKILWQMPSYGQPLGGEKLHEIIAIWYPSHKAFLSLRTMPLSEENFKLRGMCVEYAVLHRCPGNVFLD